MQVQVVSDLHLELSRGQRKSSYDYEIPVKAPHLALIGNTGCTVDEKLFIWLKAQLKKFETVFYISGNKGASLLLISFLLLFSDAVIRLQSNGGQRWYILISFVVSMVRLLKLICAD